MSLATLSIVQGFDLWGRGYFGATVGAVTEEQIKQYIENQSDEPVSFKVWNESEEDKSDHTEIQSDYPNNLDDFSLNGCSRPKQSTGFSR